MIQILLIPITLPWHESLYTSLYTRIFYYKNYAHSLTPFKLETRSFYKLWCLFLTSASSLLILNSNSSSSFQNLATNLNYGSNLNVA